MNNRKLKIILSSALACSLFFSLCGCAGTQAEPTEPQSNSSEPSTVEATTDSIVSGGEDEKIEIDTYITLDDTNTKIEENGAAFSNNMLMITKAGTYSLKGKLTDGYVFVNTNDSKKVKLYLNGVSIYSSANAPIYVENSPKETQIILAKGSVNNLADNADRTVDENSNYATATIYSKDDLQIEGHGVLNIAANFNKGVFSKNDIKICGGTLNITSADDAIRGKDSVEITAGTLNLSCGGDAIRTSNETEANQGNIAISGGKINITSSLDGIQAVGKAEISGGSINIKTAGGSTEITATEPKMGFGGKKDFRPNESSASEADDTPSTKGIKSAKSMSISGGSINIDSFDDAIHSNAELNVSGGKINVKTNDDALHCETNLTISGGKINVEQSYEGLEGQVIGISGGDIYIVSADDGLNAASPDDQSENPAKTGDVPKMPNEQNGRAEPPQGNADHPQGEMHQNGKGGFGGMMDNDTNCEIKINGGNIVVNAEGDGIDSNGSITMNSGTLIVYGSVSGGNGALDYGGEFKMNGGTLLACGSSGMAQGVSSGSIASLHFNQKFNANSLCTITDSSGREIISFASPKSFDDVVFASGKLIKSAEYNIMSGGTNSGTATNGVYKNGTVTGAQNVGTAVAG
ncbi:MAG: carbohydrate-binding domain-containing protein [Ruminococcus sp.]|nr:carbohydrate-binding domain-containing protein [Ruminococcus sp.]